MMSVRPLAVKVEHVSKTFKLPHEKHGSLKSLFLSLFRGHRTYERQKVLNDVSFDIQVGEFFGIIGRNGSGKSTLLKLLAGIYTPDKGKIHISGQLTPFIELGVGFNHELTGRENVYLNGSLLGFSRKEMDAMYHDIVEFAELERFMDQKLKNYSSGMQVRLAFSIAIRAQTEILLLDEVLAVGDIAFQKKCINYFKKLKREGKTVVFVSHDMSSIKKFCDKVLVMDKGVIDGIYDAEEGVRRYEDYNLRSEVKDFEKMIEAEKIEEDYDKPLQPRLIKQTLVHNTRGNNIITLGEKLIGELILDISKPEENAKTPNSFGCIATIFNADSVLIATLETAKNQYSFSDHKITFEIDNVALTPGLYTAYFGLYHTNENGSAICLDTTEKAVGFGVESGGKPASDGTVQINAIWSKGSNKVDANAGK